MMRGVLKTFAGNKSGGVMIEAAIAVPLFIIIISSIIQAGFIASSYVRMQDAVRVAAREMSVKRVDTGGAIFNDTCAAAAGAAADTAQRVACAEIAGMPGSYSVFANEEDVNGNSVVRLTVPLNDLLFFNIGFLGGGGTLTAEASYVNEEPL